MSKQNADWIAESAVGLVLVILIVWYVIQNQTEMVSFLVAALVVLGMARMIIRRGLP